MKHIVAGLAAAALIGLNSVAAQAQVTAFEGARLIDGNGGAPLDSATIVVDGARIVAVGRAADVKVPPGATRVSLSGKTVMPMLVDTHVHLSQTRDGIERDLKRRAWWGVSAALSMGTDAYSTLDLRAQAIPGVARFLSAGRGITMPEPGRITVPHWINNETEGRKAVEELAGHKVDMVKIWVDNRGGKYKKLTPEIFGAIIDEANKRGLRVSAHIFEMDDAKGLMKAGVHAFAHGVRDRDVDDETVAMFKARPNLVLTPNLPDRGVKVDMAWLKAGMAEADWTKLDAANTDRPKDQELFGIQARNLAKLNSAGVKIAMGTDGNRPWGPHVEMEDMVVSGMTPAQVIVAATKNSAELLRLSDTGTIAAGKSADLLVLDANPIDDIKNTRRISAVYLRGQAIDRSKAP